MIFFCFTAPKATTRQQTAPMYPVHAPACLSGKPAVCEFRYQQPELITADKNVVGSNIALITCLSSCTTQKPRARSSQPNTSFSFAVR